MRDNDLAPYAALALRLGLGVMFLAHSVWPKGFVHTLPGTARFFQSIGLPGMLAYVVFAAEAIGGLMLLAGVRVRLVALALLPVVLGATWAHWPNGWLFTNPNGGFHGRGRLAARRGADARVPRRGGARALPRSGDRRRQLGVRGRGRALPSLRLLCLPVRPPHAARPPVLGLEEAVSVSVLDPDWGGPDGWVFDDGPMATPDHVNGLRSLPEVYRKANPRFTGKVTVPALWERRRGTIVNNESAEIMRMLEVEFRAFATVAIDLCPESLGTEIDEVNAFVGPRVNGGVYRAGFAPSQAAYDEAVVQLFAALDQLEQRLSARRFLVGERLTEADLRLFATLVRFDIAYYGALRCNLRRLVDYPNLWAYTRRLYHLPGVAATVRLDHVKRHYWDDHAMIDRRILPIGPALDFGEPTAARAA